MGKALREEKGEDLRGEKALGGKGEKGSQHKMAGKHLREEKGGKGKRPWGGKGGKGSKSEKISAGETALRS